MKATSFRLKKFISNFERPASMPIMNDPPIAESFDAVTVLFADIAGFTNWSSGRPPVEVFDLLETLYADFDASARERGVFKVETIGDWYKLLSLYLIVII
jgi:class 3 adenylate cyclase